METRPHIDHTAAIKGGRARCRRRRVQLFVGTDPEKRLVGGTEVVSMPSDSFRYGGSSVASKPNLFSLIQCAMDLECADTYALLIDAPPLSRLSLACSRNPPGLSINLSRFLRILV